MKRLYLILILLSYSLFSDTITLKNGKVIEDVQVTVQDNYLISTDSSGRETKYKKFTVKSLRPMPVTWILSKLKEVKPDVLEKGLSELKGKIMPKVEPVPADELSKKLEECKELIAISIEKLSDASTMATGLDERNKTIKEQLLKRLETIMGKPVQTVVLKNGQKIQGVLADTKDQSKYTVVTAEGILEVTAKPLALAVTTKNSQFKVSSQK